MATNELLKTQDLRLRVVSQSSVVSMATRPSRCTSLQLWNTDYLDRCRKNKDSSAPHGNTISIEHSVSAMQKSTLLHVEQATLSLKPNLPRHGHPGFQATQINIEPLCHTTVWLRYVDQGSAFQHCHFTCSEFILLSLKHTAVVEKLALILQN